MLHTPVTDHAVLQREIALPLAGISTPEAQVSVIFRGKEYRAIADAAGAWRVTLDPQPAGGPEALVIREADGETVLRDLLVGDVWVCSGQSNMEFPLKHAEDGARDAAKAHDPLLRLLAVRGTVAAEPQQALPDGAAWAACTPETAADFSAVGYYFGRRMTELGVPVGLIGAAVGNTPGEAWAPMPVLTEEPAFAPILERWRRSLALYPDPDGTVAAAFAQWDHDADLAEREGRPIPGAFPKLVGPGSPWTPAGLFYGMIAPLTALPIRGVLWMQGAAAPERAFQYRTLFRRLIRAWRVAWGQGDSPFFFAQEANFGPPREEPCEHSWAELREAQALALAEPRTGMVVAIDTGEEKDIHPKSKAPLGERFALLARALVFGEDVPCSGPECAGMTVEGNSLRLHFRHAAGGLRTSDGGPLRGFAVSPGATDFTQGNRGFVWAEARIDGDDVVVSAPGVPHPVAARYAWAQNPSCNLVNGAGLPAGPFRTDDYPGVTVGNA